MRIDYSEPKKSYTSPQAGHNRPRNESSGSHLTAVVVTCVLSLGVGFGIGWTLSQRSAKKALRAAIEQQSLENPTRPGTTQAPPPKQQAAAPPAQDASQTAQPVGTQAPSGVTGSQAPADAPLGFYKNLPSGQKNIALGSGINAREEKPAKQPLQAAIPANIAKPPQPQNATESAKPATPGVTEKAAGRQDANSFTVQVASYSLKSEAETLKSKLAGKGYSAYIVESNQGNKGTWYRVRVGRGLEQDAAKELAGKLGKGAMSIPDKE